MKKITFLCVFVFFCVGLSWANPIQELFTQAKAAYERGEYKTAIKLFEQSIKIYPKLPQAYNFLALSYKNDNADPEKVKLILQRAIEVKPDYAPAYDNLSKIHYGLAEFDLAKETALKALQYDPSLISSQLTLAWTYLIAEDNPGEAIEYFKQAAYDYNIGYAYFGLGVAYVMNGEGPLVLEAVTGLRNLGDDTLAHELHRIYETGDYETALGRLTPKAAEPAQPHETLTIAEHEYLEDRNMKVRLKTQPVAPSPQAVSAQPQQDVSPAERIRELRRRSMNYDYGDANSATYY